jgi:hypothetical protein
MFALIFPFWVILELVSHPFIVTIMLINVLYIYHNAKDRDVKGQRFYSIRSV